MLLQPNPSGREQDVTTLHEDNSQFRGKRGQKVSIYTSKDNTGGPLGNFFFRQRYSVHGFILSLNHSCNHLVTIKHLSLSKDVQGRK